MRKQNIDIVIYFSAILLAIGVFLPLTRLPVYGDVTYHRISTMESYLVILFTISAPVLLLSGKYIWMKLSPIAVWVTLLFPAIKNQFKTDESGFLGKITESATSAMTDFASDLFLNIAEFRWGGYVFLFGLLAFTVSCLIRPLRK